MTKLPYTIHNGNSLDVLKGFEENSIDSIVCDPPYELGFMNKKWDSTGIAYNVELWKECLRVLKPGGHLLAFSGSRTYHRMAVAIEDAGFEVRDQIMWVYGCLSEDTQIVTPFGNKSYTEIKPNDLVLCYDKETNEYSYKEVEDIYEYNIKDTAYRIQSDSTDQIVSRNHRCIVERNGREVFEFAENLNPQENIPFLENLSELQDGLSQSNESLRGWEGHKMGMATITPIEYEGKIWCVKVPTGAFVAVRNGMAFVTGNSGFPKSLDISKAIDKKPQANKVKEWKKWLSEQIEKCPKSKKQINEECGFTATSYTKIDGKDYWSTNFPKNGKWKIMKDVIGIITDEWDWVEEDNIEERGFIETTGGLSGGTGITVGNFTGKQLSENPVSKDAQEWHGWGTALKPAHEPICLARKPLIGTVAENVLEWGVGGINIGGCRVGTEIITQHLATVVDGKSIGAKAVGLKQKPTGETTQTEGRWPANFIHDGSDDVVDLFPNAGSGNNKGAYNYSGKEYNNKETSMFNGDRPIAPSNYNDSGSVSRFFYCAKASKRDRNEGIENTQNNHPTVKPTDLMQYLCRLVTPPNGVVLDPFMGSGSTGKAAMYEGLNFIGIDLDPEYCKIAEARIEFALNNSTTTKKDTKKEKSPKKKTLQDTSNSTLPLW